MERQAESGLGTLGQVPTEVLCHVISFVLVPPFPPISKSTAAELSEVGITLQEENGPTILALARTSRTFFDLLAEPFLEIAENLTRSSTSAEIQQKARGRKRLMKQAVSGLVGQRAEALLGSMVEKWKRRDQIRGPAVTRVNSEIVEIVSGWLSRVFLIPTPILLNELGLVSLIGSISKAFQRRRQKFTVSLFFSATPLLNLLGIKEDKWQDFLTWISDVGTTVNDSTGLVKAFNVRTQRNQVMQLDLSEQVMLRILVHDIHSFGTADPVDDKSSEELHWTWPITRPSGVEGDLTLVLAAPTPGGPAEQRTGSHCVLFDRAYRLAQGKRPRIVVAGLWAQFDGEMRIQPTTTTEQTFVAGVKKFIAGLGLDVDETSFVSLDESRRRCEVVWQELEANGMKSKTLRPKSTEEFTPGMYVISDLVYLCAEHRRNLAASAANAKHTFLIFSAETERSGTIKDVLHYVLEYLRSPKRRQSDQSADVSSFRSSELPSPSKLESLNLCVLGSQFLQYIHWPGRDLCLNLLDSGGINALNTFHSQESFRLFDVWLDVHEHVDAFTKSRTSTDDQTISLTIPPRFSQLRTQALCKLHSCIAMIENVVRKREVEAIHREIAKLFRDSILPWMNELVGVDPSKNEDPVFLLTFHKALLDLLFIYGIEDPRVLSDPHSFDGFYSATGRTRMRTYR